MYVLQYHLGFKEGSVKGLLYSRLRMKKKSDEKIKQNIWKINKI